MIYLIRLFVKATSPALQNVFKFGLSIAGSKMTIGIPQSVTWGRLYSSHANMINLPRSDLFRATSCLAVCFHRLKDHIMSTSEVRYTSCRKRVNTPTLMTCSSNHNHGCLLEYPFVLCVLGGAGRGTSSTFSTRISSTATKRPPTTWKRRTTPGSPSFASMLVRPTKTSRSR